MIKELTLTILLVVGTPEELSIKTSNARTQLKLALHKVNKLPRLKIDYNKVKWIKVRSKMLDRTKRISTLARFYGWAEWVKRAERFKKIKRIKTHLVHAIDIPYVTPINGEATAFSQGGWSYVCANYRYGSNVSWSSNSNNPNFQESEALLIAHEIGHAIGLNHTVYDLHIMNPNLFSLYKVGEFVLWRWGWADRENLWACRTDENEYSPFYNPKKQNDNRQYP